MSTAATRPIADDAVAILEQVHRQSIRASVQEAAEALQRVLTRQMVAYMVNAKDVKTITRWVSGETTEIRAASEARLRAAHETLLLLERFESSDTVRAWFIGMCPQLDDVSPARAIHDGRMQDALYAARAFVADASF